MKHFLFFLLASLAPVNEKSARDFTNSSIQFAPLFYKSIAENAPGNVMVSPFAAYVALSLLESGSRGETSQQLRSRLFLPNKNDAQSLLSELINSKTIVLAENIYVQKKFPVKQEFQKIATVVYDSGAQNLDFTRNNAADTPNKWIQKKTNNTIKEVVWWSLSPQTVVLVVNALKFKADWSIHFDPKNTVKQNFYQTANKVYPVSMMRQKAKMVNYISVPGLGGQFIQLPFEGNASFHIGLPPANFDVTKFERIILDNFQSNPKFEKTCLDVTLPRFMFGYRAGLKKTLQSIGITTIFNKDQADFSGIAGKKGDLVVSQFVQRTFIAVNEKGVLAGPATAGDGPASACKNPISFTVNRPFIFLIKVNGIVGLIGRVTQLMK